MASFTRSGLISSFQRVVFVSALIAVVPGTQPVAAATRPLLFDDLARIQEIAEVTAAPDGSQVAYVVRRPLASSTNVKLDFLDNDDRGDIWVAPLRVPGAPRRLTDGARDGAGFFFPRWSPDSKRLAVVSTRGGNTRLWSLTVSTRRLEMLDPRAVNLDPGNSSFGWLSATSIACSFLAPGAKPFLLTIEAQMPQRAAAAWKKTAPGKTATVSRLESGAPSVLTGPFGSLDIIDVMTRRHMRVASGTTRDISIAPDRHRFAFRRQIRYYEPDPTHVIDASFFNKGYIAEVASRDGRVVWPGSAAIESASTSPFTWSADGRHVAFNVYADRMTASPLKLFAWNADTGEAADIGGDIRQSGGLAWNASGSNLDNFGIAWTRDDRPVIRGRHDDGSGMPVLGWWWRDASGAAHNLAAGMTDTPGSLVPEPSGAFLAAANDALWRLSEGRTPLRVTAQTTKIASIDWADLSASQTIVASTSDSPSQMVRISAVDGSVRALVDLPDEAAFAGYDPHTDTVLVTAANRSGTFVTADAPRGRRTIDARNQFLAGIATGAMRKIDYTSLDGKPLKGWIVLPVDYVAGKRYPTVALVYAGSVYGDRVPTLAKLNDALELNAQFLATRGYAVLFPSMPVEPTPESNGGKGSDPYLGLPNGVLPALDKAIDLGIADGNRLAVFGQSFGGFSAYGLITETKRFKAAIALAGPADLASLYGVFDARTRYLDSTEDAQDLFMPYLFESGQVSLGATPWGDPERYRRNSPLTYADKIDTPLMIVQGDVDYVTLTQGEEMFTALYRQGKRAEFLRYWGEGHVLRSPANITDLWNRIDAWLKTNLR